MDADTWIAIGGIVATSWIAVTPLVGASIHFYSKTKAHVDVFNTQLINFKERFQKIIRDIEELQKHQQEILTEIGPVKKNGSIVTSDQLERRMGEINNRMKSFENTVVSELKILSRIVENLGRQSDIDHKFSFPMNNC
jgi:seryl-tRNA synthetase